MAHHKSAMKRIRQTEKRNLRNRTLRSGLRTVIKQFRTLLTECDTAKISEAFPSVQKSLDKSVTKGILSKGTADRYKSRLAKAAKQASTPAA